MAERISQVLDTQTASRESTVDPNLYAKDYTGLVEGLSGVADVVIENKFLDEMGAVADQESGFYDMWRGAVEGATQAKDVETFEAYRGVISNINSAEKQGLLSPYNAQIQQQSAAKKYINRFPHMTSKFREHLAALSGDRVDRAKMLTEDPIVQEQQKIIALAVANGVLPSEVIDSNRLAMQTQDLANRLKLAASDPGRIAELEVTYLALADMQSRMLSEGLLTGKIPIFGTGESGNLETVGYTNVGKIDSLNFATAKGQVLNAINANRNAMKAELRAGLYSVMADNEVGGKKGVVDMEMVRTYEARLDSAVDLIVSAVNGATTVSTLNALIDRKVLGIKHDDLAFMNELLGPKLAALERNAPGFLMTTLDSMQRIASVESTENVRERGVRRAILEKEAKSDPMLAMALKLHTPGSLVGTLFEHVLTTENPSPEAFALPPPAQTPQSRAKALDQEEAAKIGLTAPPETETAQAAAMFKWRNAYALTGDDPSGKVSSMMQLDKNMVLVLRNPEGAKTPTGVAGTVALMDGSESWLDSRIVQDRSLAERLANRVSKNPDRIFGGDEEFPAPPLTSSAPGGGALGLPVAPKAPSREIENVNEMYRLLLTRDPTRAEEYKERIMRILGGEGVIVVRVSK